jgi:hypothetical protein
VRIGSGDAPSPQSIVVGPSGLLGGSGTIFGDVQNTGGTVSPGFSPGALTIHGNYTQNPAGSLVLQIGGTVAGLGYDQLTVTGNLVLNGVVTLSFINGYVPHLGEHYDLFHFGGSFNATEASIQLLNAPSGVQFSTVAGDGVFTVTAVPEPSTLALVGLGGIIFACRWNTARRNPRKTKPA